MEILQFFEGIRCPVLDTLFLLITQIGEDIVFTVVILGTLWCVNKRVGFWMFFSWGLGTGVNQLFKAIMKVPRPWIRYEALNAVESAKPAATGYSFPSGHTQSAFGLFATISIFIKKSWGYMIAALLIFLTGISRLYLGVHTLQDVLGAIVIGVVVVLLLSWYIRLEEKHPWITWIACGMLAGVSLILLFYAQSDSLEENMVSAASNAWKLIGASFGITLSWQVDRKFINFETDAVWYMQIAKLTVGLTIALLIQAGLKMPLVSLIGHFGIADMIRYLILTVFAGTLYPMLFTHLKKPQNRHKTI